ncbi:L-serine ammonia-lyase [Nesterenkonia alkaliphila]|uniref:L-serine ammonia-lyase n=1 Tax=Nesterenkonia alkaliphila TaxID=1463631 RepID=A0A7K1UIY1_9MICC|nr:L-serine ammonia-lyase [Nesterenkonia alkaliphila]MVT26435.1 L-serine ammonia-lyase [Nesterenkonia alkaliphila]GFZ95415.1 L-serine dehydratase [Nesterenkonia alkaliphila]
MAISVFDLFSVGVGPSSSHTVGPMRAARRFVAEHLVADDDAAPGTAGTGGSAVARSAPIDRLAGIQVELFGSLSATGAGHGTFDAILLGLEGWAPEEIQPEDVDERKAAIEASGTVQVAAQLGRRRDITLRVADFIQRPLTHLERHSNAMVLRAVDAANELLAEETYYSVGGGFVVADSDDPEAELNAADAQIPYPFRTSAELMDHCAATGLPVSEIMLANETARRPESEVLAGIWHLWEVMEACKDSALKREGPLPGGLKVRRRAPAWHAKMWADDPDRSHAYWQEWVNLVALAVNEENASGGRVVTAPTNGAAGIIPAVGFYATHYGPGSSFAQKTDLRRIVTSYLLTSAAIGVLYKEQASISGAEVGCQGEVGSASSMAAAGLCEVLGGTPAQVENAAEIAMEHNLGLTCDPISGLVQVPCIERNAIAATKAVNAARMALMGDGEHRVTLDEVIATMRETGKDMSHKYKETALGGLAVNVVEC